MPIVSEQSQRLLSLNEAADLLSVHRSTLVRAWKAGQLTIVRIGRRMLVRTTELEKFVRTHEQRSCSDARPLSPPGPGVSLSSPTASTPSNDATASTRSTDRVAAYIRAQRIFRRPGSSGNNP